MKTAIAFLVSGAILIASTAASYAQQGPAPSGTEQGGGTAAAPAVQSGAALGPQSAGVNRDTGIPNDVATGTLSGKATATGGNPGGAAGRN